MKSLLLILKWVLLFFVLIASLSFTNSRHAAQNAILNEVKIKSSEDHYVNREIILNYINSYGIFLDSLDKCLINLSDLEEILDSHPAIRNAEVYSNQKGTTDIYLEQKKAIVRIISREADYYLDEFGEIMQLCDSYSPKLLVVTGDVITEQHVDIYNFIKQINYSEFWRSQITQIHFDNNDIYLIPRVGNHKINIGNFDRITNKLDNLFDFYTLAIAKKGWDAYSEINLKFQNQIVCTKTKKNDNGY